MQRKDSAHRHHSPAEPTNRPGQHLRPQDLRPQRHRRPSHSPPRRYKRPPLTPLTYGGDQERGLRPGTLPVPLIAGLGTAAQIAVDEHPERSQICARFKEDVLSSLRALGAHVHGDLNRIVPHAVNASIPGLDSEAVMLALKGTIAISNGSACTLATVRAKSRSHRDAAARRAATGRASTLLESPHPTSGLGRGTFTHQRNPLNQRSSLRAARPTGRRHRFACMLDPSHS